MAGLDSLEAEEEAADFWCGPCLPHLAVAGLRGPGLHVEGSAHSLELDGLDPAQVFKDC